jgi:hypothetical protein
MAFQMEFVIMGVLGTCILLAVVTDKVVSIYDLDMVQAADMQGCRDRACECHDSEWNIAPIVQSFTPSPVSKLLWNCFHRDELVVGFWYVA